jgi:hypothetical protein
MRAALCLVLAVACTPQATPEESSVSTHAPTHTTPVSTSTDDTSAATTTTAPCDAEPLTLEAGLDDWGDSFNPIEDGATARVELGPAGGWSIDTSVRVSGMPEPMLVAVRPTITLPDGQVMAGTDDNDEVHIKLASTERCVGEATGIRAFLDGPGPGPTGEQICAWATGPFTIGIDVVPLEDESRGASAVRHVVGEVWSVGEDAPYPCP